MNIYDTIKNISFFENRDLQHGIDSTTNVLNRRIIKEYIDFLIKNNICFSMCLLDIDNFKLINDNFGHNKGDILLEYFANRLVNTLGKHGAVARYGGDEFIVIIEGDISYDSLWHIMHSATKNIEDIVFDEQKNVKITQSVGVVRFPIDANNYDDLFEKADKALYRGKSKGRNCFIIYLKEKHDNLVFGHKNASLYNSLDTHAKIFSFLTNYEKNLTTRIKELITFIKMALSIDQISIQGLEKIIVSETFNISGPSKINYLDVKEINDLVDDYGVFYFNTLDSSKLNSNLINFFKDENINSALICKIDVFEHYYGLVRFEMVKGRIWQPHDLDVALTISKTLGVILSHLNNYRF